MICPICGGAGWLRNLDAPEGARMPCPECAGSGVASCCDAAGSADMAEARCAACGAAQPYGRIRCEACGKPLVFPTRADPYRDDAFPERACDRCAVRYRGPSVYCSLACAVADA